MPSINSIPNEYREGFQDVFLLDEDDFKSVIDRLNSASITSSIKKLAVAATSFNPSLHDLVANIFLSVGSLTSIIEKGVSIEEVSHDICIALSDELKEEIDELEDDEIIDEDLKELLNENGKQKFIDRLSTLLKTKKLYYAAKANDLMYEYQNVFIQARVMTDIRPIFSIKMEEEPIAGLIIHNLHIHYRGDRETEHRDLFLALDSDDLKSLRDILSRAEKKEISLTSFLRKSDMKNING